MTLHLRKLQIFVAVGEHLSFAGAARRLNIAQPALSRSVRELEEKVGARLLDRTTRQVRLTTAGKVFLKEARLTLAQADHAVRSARETAEGFGGRINIGYMDFALLGPMLPILQTYRRRFPQIRVSLKRQRSDQQPVLVAANELDIGFTMCPTFDPKLEVIPLTREPLMAVLPDGHPLAKLERIPLSALVHENFVMGDPIIWRLYLSIVNDFCCRANFQPRVICEAYEGPTLFTFIAQGVGVTLYPSCVMNAGFPGIVVRPMEEEPPVIETFAIVGRTERPPAVARLAEMIRSFADGASF